MLFIPIRRRKAGVETSTKAQIGHLENKMVFRAISRYSHSESSVLKCKLNI